ncbi:MAG: hypothetical protein WAZ98_10000 [Cyclobacteriaceae bacterium]
MSVSLSLLLSFWSVSLKAQTGSQTLDTSKYDIFLRNSRNGIGFIPSKKEVINGLTIAGLTLDSIEPSQDSVIVNGVYLNVSPIMPMGVAYGGVMGVIMGVGALFERDTYKKATDAERHYRDSIRQIDPTLREGFGEHKVKGVAISWMDMGEDFSIQGVQISAFHFADRLQGLSIAPIGSDYKELKGVMISGLFNVSYKGTGTQIGFFNSWRKGKGLQIGVFSLSEERVGVQIGLVNLTGKMKGIQIGLWNKIGKRSLPFINMSL